MASPILLSAVLADHKKRKNSCISFQGIVNPFHFILFGLSMLCPRSIELTSLYQFIIDPTIVSGIQMVREMATAQAPALCMNNISHNFKMLKT